MVTPIDLVTDDGFDLQWGTNVVGMFPLVYKSCEISPNATIRLVIGHWLFTELLMPALLRAAENSPDKKARVVTTSSAGSYGGKLDYATFKDGPARRKSSPGTLYTQSKFVRVQPRWLISINVTILLSQGNAVVAWEVARRYGDRGIVSTSLHPGQLSMNTHSTSSHNCAVFTPCA